MRLLPRDGSSPDAVPARAMPPDQDRSRGSAMNEAADFAVEVSAPETVTVWRVRTLDAEGRTGKAYRLRHRKGHGHAALDDDAGTEVARTAGLSEEAELRAWGAAHAQRDMARQPGRRQRPYEVIARIATGPGAGATAGARRVLARTSAEALETARRGWDLGQCTGPGECDIVLAASAQEDPQDVSTACHRAGVKQLPERVRPGGPSRRAGRER